MSKPARDEYRYKTYQTLYQGPGGPITNTYVQQVKRDYCVQTVENPVLIKRRRSGEATFLPPLPYARLVDRDETLFGYATFSDENHPETNWTLTGYQVTPQPIDPVTTEMYLEAWNRAEAKALTKMKNQHVNFAQFFVEAGQTAALLGSTATRLAKALRHLKSGNLPGVLKDLGFGASSRQRRRTARLVREAVQKKEAAGLIPAAASGLSPAGTTAAMQWLEVALGWLPLLQDVHGTAQLLADRATQDTKRTRFNVRAVQKLRFNEVQRAYSGPTEFRHRYSGYYGALIRLDYYFTNAQLASLSADGLTNPLALVWEEIPATFLADYCSDLSEWLGNLDSSLGKEFIAGSVTLFSKWTSSYYERTEQYNVTPGVRVTGLKERVRTRNTMSRFVYGSFPDPTMISLRVRNPLNSRRHTANAVAVLTIAADEVFR